MRRIRLLIIAILTSSPIHTYSEVLPDADLYSFWVLTVEDGGTRYLKDHYEQGGGTLYINQYNNFLEYKRDVTQRIASGYPPALFQWHTGTKLQEFYRAGVTLSPTELGGLSINSANYFPLVMDSVVFDQQIIAIPTNMFSDNWAWYNGNILRQLNTTPPDSWRSFLSIAPKVKDAGYWPLAVGAQSWEIAMLFSTIILDEGGADMHQRLNLNQLTASDLETLSSAFTIFLSLRDYALPNNAGAKSYDDMPLAIKNGKALLYIMGDWVKPHFSGGSLGPNLDNDIICREAPGNTAYSAVIDGFVLANSVFDDDRSAQIAISQFFSELEVQTAFAKGKGALPVSVNADISSFDQCSQYAWQQLQNSMPLTASNINLADEKRTLSKNHLLYQLWHDPQADPANAAKAFYEIMQ